MRKGYIMDIKDLIAKEGNLKEFTYNLFKCYIKRMKSSQHLCGYVVIPESHLMYRIHYNDIDDIKVINIHGGLTFSEEVNNEWLLGFDCAHINDLQPGYMNTSGTYRDMEYVRIELESLVDQIKGL